MKLSSYVHRIVSTLRVIPNFYETANASPLSDHGKSVKRAIHRTRAVVQELVKQGITVVSGLAAGVDTIAHKTAIGEGGTTVAVLGTPLNSYYPKSNERLQNEIMLNHVAVSQFAQGSPTSRRNFPMRNRTMALLSDATVIIEASNSSGTRHQGWEALRLSREVFLLPNLLENPEVVWARGMLEHGAQIMTRESMPDFFEVLPAFTDRRSLGEGKPDVDFAE